MSRIGKELKVASQHSNGKPPLDIGISEALREKYSFGEGRVSE